MVPFVMETTGFVHEKGIELLEKIADRRQEMKRHHSSVSSSGLSIWVFSLHSG
jgi:hypothetical protein